MADCQAAFENWYKMPLCENVDIATEIAWANWQTAWKASQDFSIQTCKQWAEFCSFGKRHGCAVGARECADLIKRQERFARKERRNG